MKEEKEYIFEKMPIIPVKYRKRRPGNLTSPFDTKNKAASWVDKTALRLLALLLCILYFLRLWGSLRESLIAGLSLFALLMLTLALFERSTLTKRDRALRERIGGMMALEDLVLMPQERACESVRALLCEALGAQMTAHGEMVYEERRWLIRCAQCLRGSSASEGDVLSAHRAREACGAEGCVLCSTTGFSPAAVRAAEWVDPPVRLIPGTQLGALFGRIHPATDEEIAQHARRARKPFSFARIRSLALSPAKQRRYLLCSFLLLVMYLTTASFMTLLSCLLALVLAILCKKENSRYFRL